MKNKTLQLPSPPLPYYPPHPDEPRWNQERQRDHARSLFLYIGSLVVWMELCQSQMRFAVDVGLPVAPAEQWDSFFFRSKEYIDDLTKMLKVWSNNPMEPEDIDFEETTEMP